MSSLAIGALIVIVGNIGLHLLLKRVLQRRGPRADHVVFRHGPLKRKEARMSQSTNVTKGTQRRESVSFRDSTGIERPVTNIAWSSDNPGIVSVTAQGDGTAAILSGGASTGRAVITVTADTAIPGQQVRGDLLVDNTEDVATQVIFESGDLEPKP